MPLSSPSSLEDVKNIRGDENFKKKMNWKIPMKEGKTLIRWQTSPIVGQSKTLILY